jgi:hypothetical protein
MIKNVTSDVIKQSENLIKKPKPKLREIQKGQELQELHGFNKDYSDPNDENIHYIEDAIDKFSNEKRGELSPEFIKDANNLDIDTPKEEEVQKQNPAKVVQNTIKVNAPKLKTPKGIALLLLIIGIILFAIQTVRTTESGKRFTRLKLMWYTLLGQTYIGDYDNSKDRKPGSGGNITKNLSVYETNDGTAQLKINDHPVISGAINEFSGFWQGVGNAVTEPISDGILNIVGVNQ